jgi:hypothetical protein
MPAGLLRIQKVSSTGCNVVCMSVGGSWVLQGNINADVREGPSCECHQCCVRSSLVPYCQGVCRTMRMPCWGRKLGSACLTTSRSNGESSMLSGAFCVGSEFDAARQINLA